jgi:hypothetical protein
MKKPLCSPGSKIHFQYRANIALAEAQDQQLDVFDLSNSEQHHNKLSGALTTLRNELRVVELFSVMLQKCLIVAKLSAYQALRKG